MNQCIIFILGTGRSGTHWIGYALANHPDIISSVEEQPMFDWSTKIALDPQKNYHLLTRLIWMYRWKMFRSRPKHFLDKSHPNIWIAEELNLAFNNPMFVGIERNPFANIASMIKHQGVSEWHHRWKEFSIPNRFLGIEEEMVTYYEDLPFASKCALRWLAHHKQMNRLRKTFLPIPEVKIESLNKWQENLSSTEIQQIAEIVGFEPNMVT